MTMPYTNLMSLLAMTIGRYIPSPLSKQMSLDLKCVAMFSFSFVIVLRSILILFLHWSQYYSNLQQELQISNNESGRQSKVPDLPFLTFLAAEMISLSLTIRFGNDLFASICSTCGETSLE